MAPPPAYAPQGAIGNILDRFSATLKENGGTTLKDQKSEKIAEYCMLSQSRIEPLSSEASNLSVDARDIKLLRNMLACVNMGLQRHDCAKMVKQVADAIESLPGGRLLTISEVPRYDEFKLKLCTGASGSIEGPLCKAALALDQPTSSSSLLKEIGDDTNARGTDVKLVQTQ